jgi:hypothetical protein
MNYGQERGEPFYLKVAQGEVSGAGSVHRYGSNSSAVTGDSIWAPGGAYPWGAFAPLATGSNLWFKSTSESDTSTLTISGLDKDGLPQKEVITLTGTVAVVSTKLWYRVFRMFYGLGASNVGAITANIDTAVGTVVAQIIPDFGETQMSMYTIPANETGYSLGGSVTCGKSDNALIGVYSRLYGKSFRVAHQAEVYQNTYVYTYLVPIPTPPLTDIDFRVISTAGGISAAITIAYDLLLVEGGTYAPD